MHIPPEMLPYGVPIRMVMDSGDTDLMRAMLHVSDWMATKTRAERTEDWAKAHAALKDAVG